MTLYRRNALKGIGGMTTLTVAGCLGGLLGGGDQGTTLWTQFEEGEESSLEEHLGTFNEGRDDAMNSENISEMESQLETALPAGNGPHTFAWAHDWIGQYHDQDFVYDAADDIDVDLESTFTEAAAQAVQWDGAVHGLPYAAETVSLMYNPDLVDGPPETLSEMVAVMEDHHDPDNNQYGLSVPAIETYFVSAFLNAFGGTVFDEESGELGIEDDAFIEGIELLEDAIWPYVSADPTYEPQIATFSEGNAPYAINGPWQVSGFREAGVDATVAALPDIDGGEPSPYTGVQTWYFTTQLESADDTALETTLEWAEWYTTTEDVILSNAQDHGLIPVHQEYAQSDELGDDVEAFAEAVETGVPLPTDPRIGDVWTPLKDGLQRVFNGQASAEESMATAAEEIRGRWD
ncbi:extracellular solute-binding protein [Natrinema amylolyticum]|uniref:extracellular solute-binding protein n=1 Tax=Natrinema amylolyticum TaxID=2878679 RepID=UPI001CFA5666|nr:extracellular solute-binding protein [Natrinema amylolyticum]